MFWVCLCFFFNDTATTEIYTLSLHDALPISHLARALPGVRRRLQAAPPRRRRRRRRGRRSEEHTSELQSQSNLVCRLLLEKKTNNHPKHVCAQYVPQAHLRAIAARIVRLPT